VDQSDYYQVEFLRIGAWCEYWSARHVTGDLPQILIKIRASTRPVMKRSPAL